MHSILIFLFSVLIILNILSISERCLSTIKFLFNFMAAVSNPLSGVHSWWQIVIMDGISMRCSFCLKPVSTIDLWIVFNTSLLTQIFCKGVLSGIRNCLHNTFNDFVLGITNATKLLTIASPQTQILSIYSLFFNAASIYGSEK